MSKAIEKFEAYGDVEPSESECEGHDCPTHGLWWHNGLRCVKPHAIWCCWSKDGLPREPRLKLGKGPATRGHAMHDCEVEGCGRFGVVAGLGVLVGSFFAPSVSAAHDVVLPHSHELIEFQRACNEVGASLLLTLGACLAFAVWAVWVDGRRNG